MRSRNGVPTGASGRKILLGIILLALFCPNAYSLSSDNIWGRKSKKKHKPSPQAATELAKVDESLNQGKIANEKIVLLEVSDAPDPFNLTTDKEITLTGKFKIRYTDTLASEGHASDKFVFTLRHNWTIKSDATGLKVKELVGETAVVLPEQRRHQYFPVDVQQGWNGLDANNQPVPDGKYTYSCYGELIRTKVEEEKKPLKDNKDKAKPGQGEVPPKDGNNDKGGVKSDNSNKNKQGKNLANQFNPDLSRHGPLTNEKVKLVGVSNTLAGTLTVISVQPDTVPPVITNLDPANGSIIAQAKPIISAGYSDDLSGIDMASVKFVLDTQDKTLQATINETGFSYTPVNNLSDGLHQIILNVKDRAGNPASAGWSFTTDTTGPVITTIPANNEIITNRTPTLVINYVDAGIGLDLSALKIVFNNIERTGSFNITPNYATYTVQEIEKLPDGDYTISAEVKDLFGYMGAVTSTFTVATVAQEVQPEQGGTVAVTVETAPDSPLIGSSIEIPPAAITEPITVSIAEPTSAEAPPQPEDISTVSPAVSFNIPPETILLEPIIIKLKYNEDAVFYARRAETDIRLVKYDEIAKQWVNIPIDHIDTVNDIVVAQVTSLSTFVLVIDGITLQIEIIPDTVKTGETVQAIIKSSDVFLNLVPLKLTLTGAVGPINTPSILVENGFTLNADKSASLEFNFPAGQTGVTDGMTISFAFGLAENQTVTVEATDNLQELKPTGDVDVYVTVGPPSTLVKDNTTDNQSRLVGELLPNKFRTQLTDYYGNPVTDKQIEYKVTTGTGRFEYQYQPPPQGFSALASNSALSSSSSSAKTTSSSSPKGKKPLDASGKLFAVQDNSDFPNLKVTSSEEVHIVVRAIKNLVSIHFEPLTTTAAASAAIIISGLEPFWSGSHPINLYRYQDGVFQDKFRVDKNGNYTWTQDIRRLHHTYILPGPSTTSITDSINLKVLDTDNDGITNTEGFIINSDNITVDGSDVTIEGMGYGYGIHLPIYRKNVTIKNCTLTNFTVGIYLDYATYGNTITANNIANTELGIIAERTAFNNLNSNKIELSNGGIETYSLELNNVIDSNTIKPLYGYAIKLHGDDRCYGNIVSNNTMTGDIDAGYGYSGIYVETVGANTFSNNTITSHYNGIEIFGGPNTFTQNKIYSNQYGIFLWELLWPGNPTIYHNNIYNNTAYNIYSVSTTNAIELSYNNEGNWWGRYSSPGFVSGDSNIDIVKDTYSYLVPDGWLMGTVPGSNLIHPTVLSIWPGSDGYAVAPDFRLGNIYETNLIQVTALENNIPIPGVSLQYFRAYSVPPAVLTTPTRILKTDPLELQGTSIMGVGYNVTLVLDGQQYTTPVNADNTWKVILANTTPGGVYNYTLIVTDAFGNQIDGVSTGQVYIVEPLIEIDYPPYAEPPYTISTINDLKFVINCKGAVELNRSTLQVLLNDGTPTGADITSVFNVTEMWETVDGFGVVTLNAAYYPDLTTIEGLDAFSTVRDTLLDGINEIKVTISDNAGTLYIVSRVFNATPGSIIAPVVIPPPTPEPTPTLTIVNPASQKGIVGRCSDEPLVVQVTDQTGSMMEGVSLNYTTDEADGFFLETDAYKTVTNGQGKGGVVYVYGKTAGTHTITVNVLGYKDVPSVTFTLENSQPKIEFVTLPALDGVTRSFENDSLNNIFRVQVIHPTTRASVKDVEVRIEALDGYSSSPAEDVVCLPVRQLTDANGQTTFGAYTGFYSPTSDVYFRFYLPGFVAPDGKPVEIKTPSLFMLMANLYLRIESGYGQIGLSGKKLTNPLGVKVVDDSNNPKAGAQVTFTVVVGGGTFVGSPTRLTGADGIARIEYIFGPPNVPQIVSATGEGETVYFVVGPATAEILNPTAPTYNTADDSDDFFVKGEEKDNEDLNKVTIYYKITAPTDAVPTKVVLRIKTKDGKDVNQISAPSPKVGMDYIEWNGKDGSGDFVTDWLLTAQIEAYFGTPPESVPVKSNVLEITELSEKHKPKIFLHAKEFSSPIDYDNVLVDNVKKRIDYPDDPGKLPDIEVVENSTQLIIPSNVIRQNYNKEIYYMNFNENYLKEQGQDKLVYSRGKVDSDLIFIQYWMFYPSSTLPTNDAQNTNVYHEGDWEMMQVAVKPDISKKILKPDSTTASQHYKGETKLWNNIEIANKYNPVVYIAAGSHATYFKMGIFETATGFWIDVLEFLGITDTKDYTDEPLQKPGTYRLNPFSQTPVPQWWLWQGHWGEFVKTKISLGETASGPRSPKYRGTAVDISPPDVIKIFDEPNRFYEMYK